MLTKITEEHPYFSLAHFYLLKKGWEKRTYDDDTASKSALYFNNLYLLNKRLNEPADAKNAEDYLLEEIDELVSENIAPPAVQHHEAEIHTITAAEAIVHNETGEYLNNEPGAAAVLENTDLPDEQLINNSGELPKNKDTEKEGLLITEPKVQKHEATEQEICLLYTSPSPRD